MKPKSAPKKFNLPLLLALLVALVLIAVSFSFRRLVPTTDLPVPTAGRPSADQELPAFEPLQDTGQTPAELTADVITEFDAVFQEVETSDESLSGLDWEE